MFSKLISKASKVVRRKKVACKYFFLDLFCKNKLIINYWIPPRVAYPKHYNFGDDLNLIIPHLISGKTVIPYKYGYFSRLRNRVNYLCIGSVIGQLTNERTIIWGSGVLSPDFPMKAKPMQVLAIRGPLSRQYLLEKGIECPEIYGDPALLLPLFYAPVKVEKKHKIGIIPHYMDNSNPILVIFKQQGAFIFNMQNYGEWKAMINQICECELIISSSLHGLIISDAYAVPNIWVEFSDEIIGGRYKFLDYYKSVGNPVQEPIRINADTCNNINEFTKYKGSWKSPKIDLNQLLKCCPFNA